MKFFLGLLITSIILFLSTSIDFARAEEHETPNCTVQLNEIPLLVKSVIHPLYLRDDSDLHRQAFADVARQVRNLEARVEDCSDYYLSNGKAISEADVPRAMAALRASEEYRVAYRDIVGLSMQLEASEQSYDFWILRPLVFKTEMWRRVYKEYLEEYKLNVN